MLLEILGFVCLACYIIWRYLNGNQDFWSNRKVHRLDMNSVAPMLKRMTLAVRMHEVDNLSCKAIKSAGVKDYAGIVELRSPSLILVGLDVIKHVMVKDFDHFVNRRTFEMSKADQIVNDMLIHKKGQEWKDLRSTLSPVFTTGKIKRMFDIFNETGKKMTDFLQIEIKNASEDGTDVRDVLSRYTMDVIASTAFGLDSQVFVDKDSPFAVSTKKLQNQFKGFNAIKMVIAIFAPRLLRLFNISLTNREANEFFGNVIKDAIKRREETGERRNDLLQLLIDSKAGDSGLSGLEEAGLAEKLDTYERDAVLTKASKVQLTDSLILSQAMLFFIAGFDTTETLLLFAIYELAINPEIQDKLVKEINAALANNSGELTYDVINHMEYLDKVVSETLRKYPPGFRTERKCTTEYKMPNSDLILEKDTIVIIPIYGIHHDEEYYPDPEKFDPERFSTELKEKRNPYAYMPFGSGPRNCIAMRFALVEAKACIAHLVHKFKIEPSRKTQIPINFSKTSFKPEGGMWLKFTSRSS